jgi:MFS family permease
MHTSTPVTNVGYWQVLRHNSNFRNLWVGQVISSAGDWFNNVAVLGLVLTLTGNGGAAGLILLAQNLPFFLMIPIAGPVVDRFDRKTVMIASNFVGAALALSFLLVRDEGMVWFLFLGMTLLVTSATFFAPASQATVPNIVEEKELLAANALSSSTWGIMVMVGSAIGGIASQFLGRDTIFVINSVTFLLANFFIWQVKVPARQGSEKAGGTLSTWHQFAEGLAYVRKHPRLISLVAVKGGWGLAGGVIVLLSVFSDQVFEAGDAGIGLLYAGRGLGALTGPLLVKDFVGSSINRTRLVIGASIALTGLGYLLFALSASIGLWFGILALVVAHCGGGIMWVLSSVMLQRIVPDRYRGRVFSLDLGMSTLSNSLSTAVTSLSLSGGTGPVLLAVINAGIFIGYAMLWTPVTSRGALALKD